MLYIANIDNYLMGLKSLIRKGQPHPVLAIRTQLSSHLRENLKTLGLKRISKTLTLHDILSQQDDEPDRGANGNSAQEERVMGTRHPELAIIDTASILASVHAVESHVPAGTETVCDSPLCSVRFPPSGLSIEPRRFCSDKCRQDASIIRRAKLLEALTDQAILDIVRGKQVRLSEHNHIAPTHAAGGA